MFVRQKKSAKAPEYGGDFELTGDVLDYVLREAQRGNKVKLEISGWKRQGRGGGPFISIAVQVPYQKRENSGNQGYQQGRGSYNEGDGSGRYREPIQTSRGNYQREENRYPERNQGQGRQQGRAQPYAQQERFRNADLDDDIPF